MRALLTLFAIFCLLFAGSLATAQAPDKALLNAMLYKPVPAGGKTVAVRPMDDSDQNLILQRELESILRSRGYTVSPNAPLVLTFETRDEVGAWSDGGRRTILELEARGDGAGGDRQKARLNLFDSARGGILNEGQSSGTSVVTPDRHRLDMTLDDRQGRQRLWQAWATAETRFGGDAVATAKAMLSPMVDSIGKTVRRQAISIP